VSGVITEHVFSVFMNTHALPIVEKQIGRKRLGKSPQTKLFIQPLLVLFSMMRPPVTKQVGVQPCVPLTLVAWPVLDWG